LSILAVAVVAGTSPAASAEHAAAVRFRELVPRLADGLPQVGEVVAFEEHAHFVYLAGRLSGSKDAEAGDDLPRVRFIWLRPATLVVDLWPFDPEQHGMGEPMARTDLEVPRDGKTSTRVLFFYHSPAEQSKLIAEARTTENHGCSVTVGAGNRRFDLDLPLHLGEPGRIAVESSDGGTILARRRLPDGVLPLGPNGMRLLESWDSRYRGSSPAPWDKGFPSSHLKAAVEDGRVKPGRAVVLGCGTGTNAIYLAEKGFDVTAIDIAPTALNLAEDKAKKANVKIRWVLADVLAPPADLEPFDFIFDRGCYHGVRRGNARGYVEAAKQLSRPGTQILIIAGNANEERRYGPPRVKEEELRDDFSSDFDFVRLDTVRFDSRDPNRQGALAWSVLLRRKDGDGSR
jgi:SAM-dependent methyltransferase